MSIKARDAIDEARENDQAWPFPISRSFELARLASQERIHLTSSVETSLCGCGTPIRRAADYRRYRLAAFELPASYPKDPADRIIGATALVEDMPLVTADRAIRNSRAVPTIW